MKKVDFVFTIGYSGPSALIDRRNAASFKNATVDELLAAGLFKAAFSTALFDENVGSQQKVLDSYNSHSQIKYHSVEQLKRAFGVYSVPSKIQKTIFV